MNKFIPMILSVALLGGSMAMAAPVSHVSKSHRTTTVKKQIKKAPSRKPARQLFQRSNLSSRRRNSDIAAIILTIIAAMSTPTRHRLVGKGSKIFKRAQCELFKIESDSAFQQKSYYNQFHHHHRWYRLVT